MVRWAASDPADARVVPRAERKIDGRGERVERVGAQVAVSELICDLRAVLGRVEGRVRRASACTEVKAGLEARILRIWEPYRGG